MIHVVGMFCVERAFRSRSLSRLEDKYDAVCKALKQDSIAWHRRGPPNKRNYEKAREEGLPSVLSQCMRLLQSEAMFLILSNLTGLTLHPLAQNSASSSDTETVPSPGGSGEGSSTGRCKPRTKRRKLSSEQVDAGDGDCHMIQGQSETEVSRGGENDESRGGETEDSRGGETEESRGGKTEESRGGETEENKESSGNVREKAGKKKKDDRRQRMQQKRGKRVSGEGLPGGKTVKVDDMRERGHTSSVQQERSFADVVSQGKARKARVFMGDSIIRKVDKIVNRGDDITVCLPGAKVEDIAEKAGQVMGGGTGGAVLVHVGTNNAEKEGTSSIVDTDSSARCRLELRRWIHGSYTLLHDTDIEASELALDAMFFCLCKGWQAEYGGHTTYIAKGEDEELLTVSPAENSLALVYRDKETLRFVKHINHMIKDMSPDATFYDFSTVYFE
ncbi:Prolyl 3-hydroxylase OGFOD1 [Lamellibrachia satsuma]|nr:Prolyl 3-hydroxylase OGFOD1 [Lamellibrachia satsuma]